MIYKKHAWCTALLPVFGLILLGTAARSQAITGIWKGKIQGAKWELKLVKKGDSLVGSSYYSERGGFRHYSVKGYFDVETNSVVWWDDRLISEPASAGSRVGALPLMAVADFNCPGEGVMRLDGTASSAGTSRQKPMPLALQKANASDFPDPWDDVIANYTAGANDPRRIDQVAELAFQPPAPSPEPLQRSRIPEKASIPSTGSQAQTLPPPNRTVPAVVPTAVNNRDRYNSRNKNLQMVIPVSGDSVEIRFFDNAEIDGDSIAVFLNGQMLEEHILLSDRAHTLKISLAKLPDDNELVMVAENLGSIPPNTSLMVVLVEGRRYEAHLESTEGSSALVRLVKNPSPKPGASAAAR